ncbi:MAG TPA: NAD-dependent epimerase/dehydratase family protein [Victivallales bacterium]|nr:NAD-dependent epimerase/dehydratase family protein [Victivallales bacterium]
MKVLIVGGAGYLGSIVVPVLEKEFDCFHLDLISVKGAKRPTTIADVRSDEAVVGAVSGMDVVLYMPLGRQNNPMRGRTNDPEHIGAAFDVNVQGLYRYLSHSLKAGCQKFIYVSSMSVYSNLSSYPVPLDENTPANSWLAYGMSKRTGEFICQCASEKYPSATITSLRIFAPMSEEKWNIKEQTKNPKWDACCTGPKDSRRLFVAAVKLEKPGFHIVNTCGDPDGKFFPNARATDLLGWKPAGE